MQVPPSSINQSAQNTILNHDPENSDTSPLFIPSTQSTPSRCLNKRVAKIAASLISLGLGVVCVEEGMPMITISGGDEITHIKTKFGVMLTAIGLCLIVAPFTIWCITKEKKESVKENNVS